jgi:hypothetical protein
MGILGRDQDSAKDNAKDNVKDNINIKDSDKDNVEVTAKVKVKVPIKVKVTVKVIDGTSEAGTHKTDMVITGTTTWIVIASMYGTTLPLTGTHIPTKMRWGMVTMVMIMKDLAFEANYIVL